MNILLKPSPEASPNIPRLEESDKSLKAKTQPALSVWGAALAVFFRFFPHFFLHKHLSPKL